MDMGYAVEAAKNDAEIFSLLSAFYNINPDKNVADAILGINIEDISIPEIKEAFIKMKSFALNAGDAEIISMKCDWTKLFRGVSPEYGPRPPYEELYSGKKSPEILTELAEMYMKAGYDFGSIGNRPDYIGIQLGYIALLSVLAASSAMKGEEEEYNRLCELSESFIKRFHIWFEKFRIEAEKYVETSFYKGVLELSSLMVY